MARIITDPPAVKLALATADHQCQGMRTTGRGAAKKTEQCAHSDRGGLWPLVLVVDDARGALVLCRPCLDKLNAPAHRKAERAILPGQDSLF